MPWRCSHRETSTGQPGTDVLALASFYARSTVYETRVGSYSRPPGLMTKVCTNAVRHMLCALLNATLSALHGLRLTRRGQHPPEAQQDGHTSGKGECVRY